MARCPAVAGKFYPEDPTVLRRDVLKYMGDREAGAAVYGVVSPHAGYLYSGDLAGTLFSLTQIPDTVVIIGPNHTGFGEVVSMASSAPWQMPWGEVKVNSHLAELIKSESDLVRECDEAHRFEHSIEVQLPFLWASNSSISIVPIAIMGHDYDTSKELGEALFRAITSFGEPVTIIASSDMSHYIPAPLARERDMMAVKEILKVDYRGLFDIVEARTISMCGVMPTVAMMVASKKMGAKEGELVGYKNSGEVSGDFKEVVSYAGVLIK